jgi:hypothetical protein
MTLLTDCDHPACVIIHWPGAHLGALLDEPGTVGLVTTAAMRAQLETAGRCVSFARELLASVTTTPAWDLATEVTRTAIATTLVEELARYSSADPLTAIASLCAGRLWLDLDTADRLMAEVEHRAGGGPLPTIGQRLDDAGVDRLVVYESHHRYCDRVLWPVALAAGIAVTFVVDPALERPDTLLGDLPRHRIDGSLDLTAPLRTVLGASPARTDGPPPSTTLPGGEVSIHRIDGADPGDLPWVLAHLLGSAGMETKSTPPNCELTLPADLHKRTVLVVVARREDESTMRDRLSRHVNEPVVLMRAGSDDAAVEAAAAVVRGLIDDDPTPLVRSLLTRVDLVAPHAVDEARRLLAPLATASLGSWLCDAADALVDHHQLRPFAGTLSRLTVALDRGPEAVLTRLAELIDIDAPGRPSRTGAGRAHLAPTIARAAARDNLADALDVLETAGWSPSRPVAFEPNRPRIVVTSANRIGAVRADVVLIVRDKSRGFTGSHGFSAKHDDAAQRVLYRCLGAARHGAHVIHRGANDLMPWAEGLGGVTVHHHLLP